MYEINERDRESLHLRHKQVDNGLGVHVPFPNNVIPSLLSPISSFDLLFLLQIAREIFTHGNLKKWLGNGHHGGALHPDLARLSEERKVHQTLRFILGWQNIEFTFSSTKELFIASGEGLPHDDVEKQAKLAQKILDIYDLKFHQIQEGQLGLISWQYYHSQHGFKCHRPSARHPGARVFDLPGHPGWRCSIGQRLLPGPHAQAATQWGGAIRGAWVNRISQLVPWFSI
ncbi:hypothetical protein Taro_050821 [Colocasia esculenta]|uniref:Uncharacterized protein n=1 Tax=Colocasia esculenta TaxID=4460 RepID=A0A843XF25_COLES|nr:hypothetical protein [Colocasia esculenta]